MAKDALLQTLGILNAGTSALATATTYYSAPVSLEPFGQTGTHNNLFMRFMLAQPTYANLPQVATASNFLFGLEYTKDGTTWQQVALSPPDMTAFKTHTVNTFTQGLGLTPLVFTYPTVSSTASVTSGSASVTAAPVCSIGDALYFTTERLPFTTSTPYYVVSMLPSQASAGSATATATVQLSATPGGVPITATATGTSALTKYLSNAINFQVGELVYWTGTAAVGTPSNTAAQDTAVPPIITGPNNIQKFYVTSVTSTFSTMSITISNTPGGTNYATTAAVAASASFIVQPCLAGGEFYMPVNSISGFVDTYGAIQDNYKYIRGKVTATFPSGVNPTALIRCDIVSGKDGSYS